MDEENFSYANLSNVTFLEGLYEKYKKDPESVDVSWRYFFSGMTFADTFSLSSGAEGNVRVFRLIEAYRSEGHKKAKIDPLQSTGSFDLDPARFGFKKEEEEISFPTFGLLKEKTAPLRRIIEVSEEIYCGTVGYDVSGVSEEIRAWILERIEIKKGEPVFSADDRKKILYELSKTAALESFIHTKYPGQTRFSLEGAETLIPLLNFLIKKAAEEGAEEVLIGMSHRGRLNVLAHVLNKTYFHIFSEFEDKAREESGYSGDVKYHKGTHTNLEPVPGRFVEAALASNPSHLESIDPVVEGMARAKLELKGDMDSCRKVVPILIHGDAALSGQGVVYETIQMSRLEGYRTGGTVHIVVNNRIGYTTLPKDGRSTLYCTDIGKTFGCPIFHVNGDFPEECIRAVLSAVELRQRFHCDVFVDLNCYRKYGHNEGDEPTFTQPVEYQIIRDKKSVQALFKERLLAEGVVTEADVLLMEKECKEAPEKALQQAVALPEASLKKPQEKTICTDVPLRTEEELVSLTERLVRIPDGMQIHPKLQKILRERLEMVLEKEKALIDWGMAEHLAFASLVTENVQVRLSGQDVRRGTFSHRHAVWVDVKTAQRYVPLKQLVEGRDFFSVYDSPLSEYAVMGFDLGYSLSYPKSLVVWEAQFGDFVNGAQVVIDQYLAACEQKWAHGSNLTLLLPHGYEGKGPEHSSGRMERFLQLCAESNLIVVDCTTPAQFYHLLRRQAYATEKKPLVVFTPKLLLRHPSCTSRLSEFVQGRFEECLPDTTADVSSERIFICSGKVYYDLVQERDKRGRRNPIIRLEQLYPFPEERLFALLNNYASFKQVVWVQEEPENMGAWRYVEPYLRAKYGAAVHYAGRAASASPAVGSYGRHKEQYEGFMQKAFEDMV